MTSPKPPDDGGNHAIIGSAANDINYPRLSRSPHPYHRWGTGVLGSEDGRNFRNMGDNLRSVREKIAHTSSESGTEADDERGNLLKGLPAPPIRPRKGLRGGTPVDRTPAITPLPTPPALENDDRRLSLRRQKTETRVVGSRDADIQRIREKYTRRRRAEVVRRTAETMLLLSTSCIVSYGHGYGDNIQQWKPEISCQLLLTGSLCAVYPFQTSYRRWRSGQPMKASLKTGFHIPSRFEAGQLLYPVFLPLIVAISLLPQGSNLILPNVVLGLSSLPSTIIPLHGTSPLYSSTHWAVTSLPVIISQRSGNILRPSKQPNTNSCQFPFLSAEMLLLLYPLENCTMKTIEFLTTTSLDPSELHLLSTALVNLFLFAVSPQAHILKALVWVGGILTFILCHKALQWEIALARVPSWRFRRSMHQKRKSSSLFHILVDAVARRTPQLGFSRKNEASSDSDDDLHINTPVKARARPRGLRIDISNLSAQSTMTRGSMPASAVETHMNGGTRAANDGWVSVHKPSSQRRHTFSTPPEPLDTASAKTTPSGRPKRSMTPSSSSFLSLTPAQANICKWSYALYVYAAVIFTILVPIRRYVRFNALSGREPLGWAMGYLLGNIPKLRFWTHASNLDHWIALPARPDEIALKCHHGWVEHLRQNNVGPANTRLLLCAYFSAVLVTGIAIVLQLTSVVEVDTRRKVFHGIMVAMFLPTVFVDPCFIALALMLILAIFLLLDLFRASQLPPVSKPLTLFLAPYVDGRDHRGPVIVSHIFLLIGCAIPLWLSLAGVSRSGSAPWEGWDTDARDVSMISGIVCVGMGDAAASLVGRRFGKHKHYWPGGKSLEGSLAFAVAVTAGLLFARAWLRVGGWAGIDDSSWALAVVKAFVAASGASLSESVLTACNDNVVVPLILWLLVRGLSL